MGAAAPAVDPGGLLEREFALEALADAFADAAAGSGRLVSLHGEAGVGKTALVRRFCELCGDAPTWWGACAALFTPRPLGPVLDVAEAAGGELAELADEGAKPHHVAAALLREVCRHAPTVVVLEDVHWADEATLDVLSLLARRVEATPALIIASYRDDELVAAGATEFRANDAEERLAAAFDYISEHDLEYFLLWALAYRSRLALRACPGSGRGGSHATRGARQGRRERGYAGISMRPRTPHRAAWRL